MKLLVVSDLHTDYPANMAWVEAHAAAGGHGHDVLIVAGDVADDVAVFRKTMALLAGAYREVFWVAGNHELWLRRPEREKGGKAYDSLAKLAALRALCAELGVRTAPARLAPAPDDPAHASGGGADSAAPSKPLPAVWVVPLWSWYHASWDREPDVPGATAIEKVMLDFHACCWTSDPALKASGDDSLARRFDAMNDDAGGGGDSSFASTLARIEAERAAAAAAGAPRPFVASFSHFLPSQALLPEKRWLYFPNLAKAAGSDALGARVAALRPDAHAFGHTHFSQDQVHNGVRCVQWPLGYPHEARRRRAGEAWAPAELWHSAAGGRGGAPRETYWSRYYAENERRPEVVAPAPWAAAAT